MSDTTLGVASAIAIVVSPLVALGIQRWAEVRREKISRKLWVFKTLMMYRATPLAYSYVQALNLIDVEFSANRKKEKAVRTAWKILLDHLTVNKGKPDFVDAARELTATLLAAMGRCLGYEFDSVQLKRAAYQPEGHGKIEEDNQALRRLVLEVLNGNRRIPIAFFPDDFNPLILPDEHDEV